MWVRLHTAPKRARALPKESMTAQQRWLFSRSAWRYNKSPDGIKVSEMSRDTLRQGEVGAIDLFRFYVTSNLAQKES